MVRSTKCDVCHKKLIETKHDWTVIKERWGYCSNKDGRYDECVCCSDCYDKVAKFINKIGGRIRQYKYDPLDGLITNEEIKRKGKNAQYKNR